MFFRCEISCECWSFTTKTISVRPCMLSKSIESDFSTLNWIAESEKVRCVYSREILLNTATIREVNPTEIDSNFTARETQDYVPLQRQATNNLASFHNFKTRNWIYLQPCIRLVRGKFELTNQDSAGGKISSVLTSSWNQATFVTGDDIKYPRKGIYNFKNQTSLLKVENRNHFVFLSFYFGAKNGSPALCMATLS